MISQLPLGFSKVVLSLFVVCHASRVCPAVPFAAMTAANLDTDAHHREGLWAMAPPHPGGGQLG